jgi:DNA-binding CsgD family transcriptional regulator
MRGTDLIERDAELAAIDAALEAAERGTGGVLALEGPAGAGKTALLRAALARAEARGMSVLSGRAGEFEQGFPFGVARQLFERRVAEAEGAERERLLGGPAALSAAALGFVPAPAAAPGLVPAPAAAPGLAPAPAAAVGFAPAPAAAPSATGPAQATAAGTPAPAGGSGAVAPAAAPPDEFAVLHGLYWLVANLAQEAPVVLAVDDAHWADPPSMQLLAYLGRRIEDLGVLVVVSVREGEAGTESPVMTTLLADPATVRLAPAPLSAAGVEAVLRAVLGGEPDPAFARACAEVTAGNPFLLGQLADAVRAHDLEPTAEAAARVGELGPRTVARATLLRLGGLPAPARALAQALAVLGPNARLRDAAEVAGLEPGVAARAADELRRIDLAHGDVTLDFVHPIVRSAVYRDLAPADRSAAHARAAAVLRAAGAAPADVAPHLLSVEPAGDDAVVGLLCAAGRQALARGAAAGAAELLRRALAEPPAGEERAAVLADLGDAELRAGELEAADRHLSEAVEATADPHLRCRRRILLARARSVTESPAAAAVLLERGLAEAEGDRELELTVATELASAAGMDHDAGPRARESLGRHASLPGDTPAERMMLAALARQAYLAGRPAATAAAFARRALAGDRLVREAGPDSTLLHQTILVATAADDVAVARAAIDAAATQAHERGSVLGFAYARASRGLLELHVGDVDGAEADVRDAIAALGEYGGYVRRMLLAGLVEAMTARGALDEAEQELAAAGALGDLREEGLTTARLQLSRAALRLAQGRAQDAIGDLREIAAREAHWRVADRQVAWRSVLALAYAALGDADAAERLAREDVEVARSWGTPTFVGRALRVLGTVVGGEQGLADLRAAVTLLEQSPARLELATAQTELGAALRAAGRPADARDPLRQAGALAGECRATALRDRARDELVAAGARPRRLEVSGAEALTASERRVAGMAATGRTNREIAEELFVTVKTVENHLGRAYAKLGIRGRDQLPAALGDRVTTS